MKRVQSIRKPDYGRGQEAKVMHEVKAKGILSAQNGMNIYRGCTHGCIYCDARSTCYQMDHAFEDFEISMLKNQKAGGKEKMHKRKN